MSVHRNDIDFESTLEKHLRERASTAKSTTLSNLSENYRKKFSYIFYSYLDKSTKDHKDSN